MRRLAHTLLPFFLALSGNSAVHASNESDQPVVLAIHPYLSFQELKKRYKPLADHLEKTLNKEVVIRIGRNYDEHITYVGKDQVDIAYMGPAAYVQMAEKYGKKPLLARLSINGEPVFRGYLVTSSNSDLQDIQSLRGKRLAFGDPKSTMSHFVPRHMMLEAGIDVDMLEDYQFLGSHKNVALAVLSGAFDAGAVKEGVFNAFKPRGLTSIAGSDPFSEHLFVARSDAPEEFVETVRNALYQLSGTAAGRAILRTIKQSVTALVPVEDSDYDNLRAVLETLGEHGVE